MFIVAGRFFPHEPRSVDVVIALAKELFPRVIDHIPYKEDFYWFAIEQYDRLHGYYPDFDEMLESIGLQEYEYKGRRSAKSSPGKPNPGVVFMEEQIRKPIAAQCDEQLTHYIMASIYLGVCNSNQKLLNAVRLEYAQHYFDSLVAAGDELTADKWLEVMFEIPEPEELD